MFHQSRFIEEEIINRVKNHQIVNKYLPPILTNKGMMIVNLNIFKLTLSFIYYYII